MKMFNLLNIGERAGSGIPSIYYVWTNQHWETPVLKERFVPERTVLLLPLKKVPITNADKKTPKTLRQKEVILRWMK